ncbi:hypothetical protein VHEMI10665 [[Torrubiella] hemipterigena]|uniref:Uncharacterized protein n=1 Tax=[Torrubiella] hemipterigena TaxID=1531966 RepID=A0A0A1TSN0_9HYPO|nr:hypothetical protein VHEMI10665 [[Torrubiella] hemipterigena]
MDELHDNLRAAFADNFEIKADSASGWLYRDFKKKYAGMAKGQGLLRVSPKTTKCNWASKFLAYSSALKTRVQDTAETQLAQYQHAPAASAKLFPDSVLNHENLMAEHLRLHDNQPLTEEMQHNGFWLAAGNRKERARATRALLERQQLPSLLQIANTRRTAIRDASSIPYLSGYWSDPSDCGWFPLADDIIQITIFVIILSAFKDELIIDESYVELEEYGAYHDDETSMQRFMALNYNAIRTAKGRTVLLARCVMTMVHLTATNSACGLPPIDWQTKINDTILMFIKFGSWDQIEDERYGQKFFAKMSLEPLYVTWPIPAEAERSEMNNQRCTQLLNRFANAKPRDPLYLRPRKDQKLRNHDDNYSETEDLAILEREEAAYGSKRSLKYQARHLKT